MNKSVRSIAVAVLGSVLLAGCSTLKPDPITPAEHVERAQQDQKALAANFVPLTGPLTLDEAIARSIRYNYDTQLAKMEISLQERQLDLALTQMLPRLAVDAGYTDRNNDNASRSVSEQTKQQSLESSFSEQREHGTADLQFSWNLLDLGVSYFQAKQQGYRALIAVERRRKVIDGLVKDVQGVYWKAVAAQNLLPRLEKTLNDAEHALEGSRSAQLHNLQPPLVALDFQQNMLQIISQLRHTYNDLNSSKVQLASMVNANPETMILPQIFIDQNIVLQQNIDIQKLEQISLALRPELREEAYQERISRQDIYKEIIKMMPGVNFMSNLSYDSNKYLSNSVWDELGVRATLNLVNFIQGPEAIKAAEAAVDVAHQRRLALSVAVLTQLHLSYQQYINAMDNVRMANQVDAVQQQITKVSGDAKIAQTESESEHIRRSLTAMMSELDRDRAYIELQASLANLYTSIGADIVPPTVMTDDLQVLTEQTHQSIADWQAGRLPDIDFSTGVPTTQAPLPVLVIQ